MNSIVQQICIIHAPNVFTESLRDALWAKKHIEALVVHYGISNTIVLEIP